MSEISKFEAYKKKLQGICDENQLVFRFRNNTYPITLTIRPISGFGEQLSMLEMAGEQGVYTSPDASLVFSYCDGEISYKTSSTFTISEALFSKLKNLFKNMYFCWLQYFFRNLLERGVLKGGAMPVIDEDDAEYEEADTDDAAEDDVPEENEDDEESAEGVMTIDDYLVKKAVELVHAENKCTIGLLQRRLNIGAAKAARVRDELEQLGVIGPIGANGEYEVLPVDIPDDSEGGEI